MPGGSVVDELVVVGARVVLVVEARVVLVATDVVVVVDEDELEEAVPVVDDVEDVDDVVVGARVVLVVVEVADGPTSVTLITFDGPLSDGAAGSLATMATVSVSVCPGAGSPTVNVSAQGVAAHTTEAG
jgi:hypothetical protein